MLQKTSALNKLLPTVTERAQCLFFESHRSNFFVLIEVSIEWQRKTRAMAFKYEKGEMGSIPVPVHLQWTFHSWKLWMEVGDTILEGRCQTYNFFFSGAAYGTFSLNRFGLFCHIYMPRKWINTGTKSDIASNVMSGATNF